MSNATDATEAAPADCAPLIPLPIVRLNRLTIVLCVLLAYGFQVPLITTVLFVVIALAAAFGRRASLIYRVGMLVLRPALSSTDGEDPRLMRFNNTLAALMLGAAQVAFAVRVPLVGWIFAGLTALAAAVALAGFCVGCFLFYQFRLNRARLVRQR